MFLLLTNISFSILNKSYLKNNQIFYKLYFYTLFSPYIKKLFLRKITFDVRLNTGFFYFVFYLFKKSLFFRYNQLIDIICIDFLKNPRFLVEYILLSLKYSDRLYLSLFTSELDYIPSLSRIFFNANWLEREIWDLFGVFFFFHSDLRRLLTDYGFSGHPFRKDFPVSGFVELFYDENKQKLYYSSLALAQEFRIFTFTNPWRRL